MSSSATKVAVFGASGRMGVAVCEAVGNDDELELVARVERPDDRRIVSESGAQVAVDFTTPSAVRENVRFCLDNSVHVVVGTTGLGEADLEEIKKRADGGKANVVVAPNFALGAVLMMSFAARAAPYFDRAEIVERHHERKLDAPSGTARRTALLMNEARARPWLQAAAEQLPWQGGDEEGIRIHSIRLPGSVAHQEVVLGSPGQTLTIRHDSIDRSSFMPGVLLAIKSVGDRPGLTVGLEALLGL